MHKKRGFVIILKAPARTAPRACAQPGAAEKQGEPALGK